MEEKGTKEREGFFERVRDHAHHGADRMRNFRLSKNSRTENKDEGGQVGGASATGDNVNKMVTSNMEDFPYDSNREDDFTSELLSAAAEEDDGIGSPKSQCSMETLYSSASNVSWTSTQKNVGGIGLKEGRSQEVLGPYKSNAEEGSEAVPSEYQNYVDDQNWKKPAMNGGTVSAGNHSLERSSSTASELSVPDSLYADLSSISDRDIHVPEGLVTDGYDSVCDAERTSPNRPAQRSIDIP